MGSGGVHMCGALLLAGAKIGEAYFAGRTLLHVSIDYAAPATVKFLLSPGADGWPAGNGHSTAFHAAARCRFRYANDAIPRTVLTTGIEIVTALSAAGANSNTVQ